MKPDPEVLRKSSQWLEFAEEDLRLARHGLTLTSGVPYRLIAFHAQQCAEKYLKAYLVYHGIDFPYTHNISRLLELCAKKGGWVDEVTEAEELTPFAITARYPGEDEKVAENESIHAIEVAAQLRNVVRGALLQDGMDLPADTKG
jgi:HEPN domain-containing protein